MTLEPLLAAPLLIQVHAIAALSALAVGIFQLAAPKGTKRHRITGWIWAGLMATIVVTSFGIHEMKTWGSWSPIHLLSVFTAVMLPLGLVHARRHRVKKHRASMIWLFVGALIMLASLRSSPAESCTTSCSGDSSHDVFETTVQLRNRGPTAADAHAFRRQSSKELSEVGFREVIVKQLDLKPVPPVCVPARK